MLDGSTQNSLKRATNEGSVWLERVRERDGEKGSNRGDLRFVVVLTTLWSPQRFSGVVRGQKAPTTVPSVWKNLEFEMVRLLRKMTRNDV